MADASASQAPYPQTSLADDSLYAQVESFPWQEDLEFKSGLDAILGPDPGNSEISQQEDLALRARCYYFKLKRGSSVGFTEYKAWRATQSPSSLSPLLFPDAHISSPPPPREANEKHGPTDVKPIVADTRPVEAATFNDIMELIKSGKPIPGIREIPDTVLVGQGTESTQVKRMKPWEKGADKEDKTRPFFSDKTSVSS